MDLSQLFTLSYYFDFNPQAGALSTFAAIYFLGLLILRAHFRMLTGKHEHRRIVRKLQKKHLSRLATIAVLGVLNIGARRLGIAFFSMRIWMYLFIVWSLYELWNVYTGFNKRAHAAAAVQNASKKAEDKYIPRPKKKKRKKKR